METFLISVWLLGWVAATVFAAAVIGNVDNIRGSGDKSFPTFIWPLAFGWIWPLVLAVGVIVAPLAWLSDRTTKRGDFL